LSARLAHPFEAGDKLIFWLDTTPITMI